MRLNYVFYLINNQLPNQLIKENLFIKIIHCKCPTIININIHIEKCMLVFCLSLSDLPIFKGKFFFQI